MNYKEKKETVTTLTFNTLDELKSWCEKHMNDGLSVYWGWLENLDGWCSVADLASDADESWFIQINEDGDEVACTVDVYVKDKEAKA